MSLSMSTWAPHPSCPSCPHRSPPKNKSKKTTSSLSPEKAGRVHSSGARSNPKKKPRPRPPRPIFSEGLVPKLSSADDIFAPDLQILGVLLEDLHDPERVEHVEL